MTNQAQRFSLSSQPLRYKLRVAFYLMSVLPLLILLYLVSNYILPQFGMKSSVTVLVVVGILISSIGFFIIKKMVDYFVTISSEARLIAKGDTARKIDIETEDEIGGLSMALNQITQRIRDDMDKIKDYSKTTAEINSEIQRHVVIFSGLLQIGSMISQGAKLEEIFNACVANCRFISNSDTSYLLFKKEDSDLLKVEAADGINAEQILKVRIEHNKGPFVNLIRNNQPLIWDKRRPMLKDSALEFNEKFGLSCMLALPVYFQGMVMGILGIGSCKQLLYNKDEIEILELFTKQIAIAVENERLLYRLDKLEINDTLTGLYNASYISTRLQEEIRRAIVCQRPCALALFDIDGFAEYRKRFGGLASEKILKKIALLIKSRLGEIERVGRFSDTEFAVVLPERNKRQAEEVSEDIREKIEADFAEISDSRQKLSVSGGVSENPLDGVSADELIKVARDKLLQAKAEGGNRVKG
ncbi:MAG: diguanylate cyclase [Candidatus Omnitrophica bacterium]|nr:diguanylate cyclase [Candidatus Omnitrophota bacterium]